MGIRILVSIVAISIAVCLGLIAGGHRAQTQQLEKPKHVQRCIRASGWTVVYDPLTDEWKRKGNNCEVSA